MIAALALVGCSNGSDDDSNENSSSGGNTTAAWDGVVDMTKLTGYDADLGGVAKMFNPAANSYNEVVSFTLSELGFTDGCGFTKVYILAEVYNVDQVDLASDWGSRLILNLNGEDKEFNAGVVDAEEYGGKHAIGVAAASDTLQIKIKDKPVTCAVITKIIFE